MSNHYQIKQTVHFDEWTVVGKKVISDVLFDLVKEDVQDNTCYCEQLINRILSIPYKKLPDFILYHCSQVRHPVKWLGKLEILIARNEEVFVQAASQSRLVKCITFIEGSRKELRKARDKKHVGKRSMKNVNAWDQTRYFSFRKTKKRIAKLPTDNERIIFLTKEKFEYEQANHNFVNPNLPDYAQQCQKEIDHIQHLNCLADKFSEEDIVNQVGILPFTRLQMNCNINQLVDVFYRLNREMFVNDKPILDGNVNDFIAVIVNCFLDKNGRELSPQTVRTIFTPSKTDKRPKPYRRVDLDGMF